MDLPFLKELEKEEIRFKRFEMSGDGSVKVAGNIRTGYTINIDKEGGGSGGGTPVAGACCLEDGSCVEETFGECLADGGIFYPGLTCDDVDCSQGACCAPDGTCSITTEEDCTGVYQGNGTVCDPNPCPDTSTGACCHGEACDIETQADCEGSGGTYQGDDTTCDPNPCCCDCGFTGFLTGQKYLTKTTVVTRTDHTPSNPEGCLEGCDSSWNLVTTHTIAPDADCNCVDNVECSGGATVTDCGGTTTSCAWVPDPGVEDGCDSEEGCSVFSLECNSACPSPDTGGVIDDTHYVATCHVDFPPPNDGAFTNLEVSITLSNPIC